MPEQSEAKKLFILILILTPVGMTDVEFEPKPHHARSPYKLAIIRGVQQNPTFDEEGISNLISSFELRSDDVFICTYPKSGTTWTQQMVNLLQCDGKDPPRSYSHAVPWLETLALKKPQLANDEAKGWSLESLQAAPGPRVFKTHANIQDLPGRFRSGATKVIYVARNPKDVAVSMYYHARNKKYFEFNGSFSDMFDHFYGGSCECGSWFIHVLDWWKAHLKVIYTFCSFSYLFITTPNTTTLSSKFECKPYTV